MGELDRVCLLCTPVSGPDLLKVRPLILVWDGYYSRIYWDCCCCPFHPLPATRLVTGVVESVTWRCYFRLIYASAPSIL
jgi:hypothetical protein